MLFYCTDISRADAHPTELTLYILVIEYIKKYIFVNNKYVENSDVSLYNVNEHKEITLWSNQKTQWHCGRDERWLEKSYDRYAGSFSFEAKANVCLRNASGNGPA